MSEAKSSPTEEPVEPETADEHRPDAVGLPPIPDGGLAESMPVWLKQSPSRPAGDERVDPVDMAALAESLELPSWLSALSDRVEASKPRIVAPEKVAPDAPANLDAIPPAPAAAAVDAAEAQEDETATVEVALAAPQGATTDVAVPLPKSLPPVPQTAAVDPAAFLRNGEVPPTPERRSRLPYIALAALLVLLAVLAVWYFAR